MRAGERDEQNDVWRSILHRRRRPGEDAITKVDDLRWGTVNAQMLCPVVVRQPDGRTATSVSCLLP
jgi:hypothetical protein